MRREFLNSRFLIILGGLLVIGGYYVFQLERNPEGPPPKQSQTPIEDKNSSSQSLSKIPNGTGKLALPTRIESAHPHHPWSVDPSDIDTLPIPADNRERIEFLTERLPYPEAKEKTIEILAEEMDALNVAKYLRTRGWSDEARQYVDRAVAENPDSSEALLLWCQLRPPEQAVEREAGFRKLLQMNPNSVEALIGLGTRLLFDNRPEEALGYLEKASRLDPERPPSTLGFTYEELGEYDKALVALKKSYKMTHSPVVLAHIQAIEAGNPLWQPKKRELLEQPPESSSPETVPESSPQEDALPMPDTPSGLERETGFDNEPGDFTPPSENSEATAAEQREISEFLRMLDEYETSIGSESDLSATVKGRIADLERSIESNPNQKEHYLELAEAYQEAGEHEKAAEVYRRARERFRDDEEVQQESESYRESPEREDEDDEER